MSYECSRCVMGACAYCNGYERAVDVSAHEPGMDPANPGHPCPYCAGSQKCRYCQGSGTLATIDDVRRVMNSPPYPPKQK